ncbi:MAG TPA: xanthine dehydrogenase small subunit [Mesorhizobium sp.]|jgi:xanthine dehydrogenase small subunit|nr:xanthine dehydrogenase small subunit [Mesorhizobium sp.]
MPETRNHIRFILNGEDITLNRVRPDETLLDFLRLRRGLVGTKEGCAEGDCGACTVLAGRLEGERVTYRGLNACIAFTASLDGAHVVTVEHLRGADGGLHPVQRALVQHHGSQCGFCTPGFVMTLAGLRLEGETADDARIEKALQGNLCRCTGYESIVRAARAALADPEPDTLAEEAQAIAARLRALQDGARVEMGEGPDRLVIPAGVDDLAAMLEAEPEARIVAGATDVGLWVTKAFRAIGPAVFIGHLRELKRAEVAEGKLRIGAGVSYTEAQAALAPHLPALAELIDRIGGEQIRNGGTVGGNIANGSPIGDMTPGLIALDATLTLRKGASRRTIPLENFFIAYGRQDRQPGEFVEWVDVPLPEPGALFALHKISKRRDEDITAVLGAFHVQFDGTGRVAAARIAYGGMAGTPKRAAAVEAALQGRSWTMETVEDALPAFERDFSPLTDMRASTAYRMLVAKNLLRRTFLESSGTKAPLRVRRHEAA